MLSFPDADLATVTLPPPPFAAGGTAPSGTTTTININVPRGVPVLVSVAVEEVYAGAVLSFVGNDANNDIVRVGAELGTTRYVPSFDVKSIVLTSYSATSDILISAWLEQNTRQALRKGCD